MFQRWCENFISLNAIFGTISQKIKGFVETDFTIFLQKIKKITLKIGTVKYVLKSNSKTRLDHFIKYIFGCTEAEWCQKDEVTHPAV